MSQTDESRIAIIFETGEALYYGEVAVDADFTQTTLTDIVSARQIVLSRNVSAFELASKGPERGCIISAVGAIKIVRNVCLVCDVTSSAQTKWDSLSDGSVDLLHIY